MQDRNLFITNQTQPTNSTHMGLPLKSKNNPPFGQIIATTAAYTTTKQAFSKVIKYCK